MNVVDIIIIALIFVYVMKGFSNGVIKEAVSFVGGIAVIILAYFIKNPLSVFLYEHLPFFNFDGILSGVSVLNILVYELISFLIVASVLMIIYKIIVNFTKLIEMILRFTIILGFPSKILGALIGFTEGVVVTFIILFIFFQFDDQRHFVEESKYGNIIITKTPVLANAVEPVYTSVIEIYEVAEKYKESFDKTEVNLQAMDILLKYKVLDIENAISLIDSGKLKIDGVDKVLEKYKLKEEV